MNEAQIIQNAYLAYYGRPADPAGLDYWSGRLKDAGGNLGEIIAAFGSSAEFTERFGQLDTTELVEAIYQRLFKRDADPKGLAFYRDLLESGEKHLGSIALDIFNGVKREGDRQSPPLDWEIIQELQRTADAFTEQVRLGDLDYSGERGLEVGTQMIASIPNMETEFERERSISGANNSFDSFLTWYIRPDWYAGMFTSQLSEDRSVISIDRINDIGGSSIGHGNSPWGKIHSLWPEGEKQVTIDGQFQNSFYSFDGPNGWDVDGYYLYNLPAGDYRIELAGDELPDNAGIEFFKGHYFHSNYWNNSSVLQLDEGTLVFQVRIETPMTFQIDVLGDNTDALYELTVTRQAGVQYPVYEPEWISRDNSVRQEFLDFIFVEAPPEFYDYML